MLDLIAKIMLPALLKRTGVDISQPDVQTVVQTVAAAAQEQQARGQETDAHVAQLAALQAEREGLLAEVKALRVQLDTYRRLLRGRLGG